MITKISIFVGSEFPPTNDQLTILMADICDVLTLNGDGNVLEGGMPANSVVIAKFLELDPDFAKDFFESEMENSALAMIPVEPTEQEEVNGGSTTDHN